MRDAVLRLAIWASAGLMVSIGWGVYFASANKALPVEPLVYALAGLTQPAAGVRLYLNPSSAMGLTWVAVVNLFTYALLGVIVETIRRHHRSAHSNGTTI